MPHRASSDGAVPQLGRRSSRLCSAETPAAIMRHSLPMNIRDEVHAKCPTLQYPALCAITRLQVNFPGGTERRSDVIVCTSPAGRIEFVSTCLTIDLQKTQLPDCRKSTNWHRFWTQAFFCNFTRNHKDEMPATLLSPLEVTCNDEPRGPA